MKLLNYVVIKSFKVIPTIDLALIETICPHYKWISPINSKYYTLTTFKQAYIWIISYIISYNQQCCTHFLLYANFIGIYCKQNVYFHYIVIN